MVYLIHFDTPLKHARHYVGWSSSGQYGRAMVTRRLQAHADGRGSRLMRAVTLAGIGWRVVRVWPMWGRSDERTLKRSKNVPRYCPVCAGRRSRLRAAYWTHREHVPAWGDWT